VRSTRLRRPVTWLLLTAVAASAVVVVAAASLGATRRITGRCSPGCRWRPATRTIQRGDRIVWRVPLGDRAHTVTSTNRGRNWSKNTFLSPGESTRRRFRRRGTYYFVCTLHRGMNGKIVVTG
jgi:plastocyanin